MIEANGAGLETVVVRPRFVWGAGDTTLLPILVDMARSGRLRWIGGGRQLTSTTHVENTVEGLVLAAERGTPGNAYFVTDGSPVVFREFVSALLATQGVQAPEGELPLWAGASGRARVSETAWRLLPLPRRAARRALRGLGLARSRPRSTTPRRASSSATGRVDHARDARRCTRARRPARSRTSYSAVLALGELVREQLVLGEPELGLEQVGEGHDRRAALLLEPLEVAALELGPLVLGQRGAQAPRRRPGRGRCARRRGAS